MVSAKTRNRAVVEDTENNINNSEELRRTIKSRYKDLAAANSLEDFILKLASIGENLPSVKVNLYPNNLKILYDRDQLKLLPKSFWHSRRDVLRWSDQRLFGDSKWAVIG